jgi:hypothetical protein
MHSNRLDYVTQDDLHPDAEMVAANTAPPDMDVHVIVDGPVATTTAATQFGAYTTFSIPASGVVRVLPRDPNREYAYITSVDNPVVLCNSMEAAQASANTAASVPNPQGYYLNNGSTTPPIRHNEAIYAANTSTSAASRVSVIIERGNAGS